MTIAIPLRLFAALALIASLASTANAELRDFDAKSLARIRAQNAGRPFVLALWSIHCEPCREELGQWGSLQRRHPSVPIVLVATDGPEEHRLLEEMLSTHDLGNVTAWAFADEFEERVRYSIDPEWRGELPRTYLFDATHRAEGRSGPAEPGWIEPWLEQHSGKIRDSGSARYR